MSKTVCQILLVALVVTSCSPTLGSPAPPRPVDRGAGGTTTQPAPTTTVVTVASEALQSDPECLADFCLVYHLDPRARWSDGSPLTGEDLAHTVTVYREVAGGNDYSRITDVEILDDRSVLVAFGEDFGSWPGLFSRIFRAGEQPSAIADISTTGPFEFVDWVEGDRLTIARATDWWAPEDPLSAAPLGSVEEITFVFIDEQAAMVDALASGEVDVIVADRPDAAMVEQLTGIEGVGITLSPGPFWEHIDFNHEHPLMSRAWVRTAIALGIDREKILDRTVRLIDGDADSLDSSVYMEGTPGYEPHYPDRFDPVRAEQILADNGCSRGGDGVMVCDGERMSFVWASTNDDAARREILESVREDLDAIGVELTPDLRSPSSFVTREFLFGGPDVWQLINFSWRARPDPIGSNSRYYCGEVGDLNVNRYCSEEVEALIRASEVVTDPIARTSLYNEADRRYLEDRALIPLYQKPTLMAWSGELMGPEPNSTLSADLWNVAAWSGKESIVVALGSEPVDMSPLAESDDSANVILGALLYGAFGMTPSQESRPVLVESVDLIEGRP